MSGRAFSEPRLCLTRTVEVGGTGDPNVGLPVDVPWPAVTASSHNNLLFDLTIAQEQPFRAPFCDMWDSVGYTY